MIGTLSLSTITVEQLTLTPRALPADDGPTADTCRSPTVTIARSLAVNLNVVAAEARARIAALQAKALRERQVATEEEIEPSRHGDADPSELDSSRALLAYQKADQTRFPGAEPASSGTLVSLIA
jgi:hypothetical protein